MQLSYDDIIFDVLLLKNWLREAVYTEDKTTFLYWHHVIEVVTILNDDATNAEFFNNANLRRFNAAADDRLGVAKDAGGAGGLNPASVKKWSIRVGPLVGNDSGPGNNLGNADGPALPVINPNEMNDIPRAAGAGAVVGAPGEIKKVGRVQFREFGPNKNFPVFDVPPGVAKPGVFNHNNNRPPRPNRINHTVPTTDKELRQRLANPRRNLWVWLYTGANGKADFILQSPQRGAGVDATTGPICTVMDCTAIHGQQTSVMTLRFETWEAPPIEFTGDIITTAGGPRRIVQTPAVLSHRWQMSFGFDPQNYLRNRLIEGEVIFRSDVLKLRGLSADQLRPYFMCHVIPDGYVRAPDPGGMVRLNTEGNGVEYKIMDEQKMVNFPGGAEWGMVKIEAVSSTKYSSSEAAEGIGAWVKRNVDRTKDNTGLSPLEIGEMIFNPTGKISRRIFDKLFK